MSIESLNISFPTLNFTPFEKVDSWIHQHPTTIKVLKVVTLLLGIGLLASIPFTVPLETGTLVTLALVGSIALITSLFLFTHSNKQALPTEVLWDSLKKKTQEKLQTIDYLPTSNLRHRFTDIRCPKETAVLIEGQCLHANTIGKGICKQTFIASQAPLKEECELFWKAVFEHSSTLLDLTTLKDQESGGVIKYYPETVNQTLKYGAISIKLLKIEENTHTYQVENTKTKEVKTIKRFHYTDWKDFDAISLSSLHFLVQKIEKLSSAPKKPVWIHCRAGVGRTGSLITALILKEKIKLGEITEKNLDTALVDLIVSLRKQRGESFVQQKAQLQLLREYGQALLSNSPVLKKPEKKKVQFSNAHYRVFDKNKAPIEIGLEPSVEFQK